jgi:hypothetical protein
MITMSIEKNELKFTTDQPIDPRFMNCLIPALLAAWPAFLKGFTQCMGGGELDEDYQPCDRQRCD